MASSLAHIDDVAGKKFDFVIIGKADEVKMRRPQAAHRFRYRWRGTLNV